VDGFSVKRLSQLKATDSINVQPEFTIIAADALCNWLTLTLHLWHHSAAAVYRIPKMQQEQLYSISTEL